MKLKPEIIHALLVLMAGVFKYIGARYHITDDSFAEHLYNLQAIKLKLPPLTHQQEAA